MPIVSTVAVCALNEEQYVEDCLASILAQTLSPSLVIVVVDRSNDKTEEMSRSILSGTKSLIIVKSQKRWRNSISENLEMARETAVGDAFVIVDADMVLPLDFLERLLPQLERFASVSAVAVTDPSPGFLNALVFAWEKTHRFAPLGAQPRGGCRAVDMRALNELGGFRDVISWDTDLDFRFLSSGYLVKLDRRVKVLHKRKMTLQSSIAYQMAAGEARRELGVGMFRTILHAIFRLRPFVVCGYVRRNDGKKSG